MTTAVSTTTAIITLPSCADQYGRATTNNRTYPTPIAPYGSTLTPGSGPSRGARLLRRISTLPALQLCSDEPEQSGACHPMSTHVPLVYESFCRT